MENQDTNISKGTERRGLALSGMIIGLVGLLCSLIYGWRMFAIIISFLALIVSVISLKRAIKYKKVKSMQFVGILSSIAAILIGSFFLYTGPDEKNILEGDKMPVNTRDDGVPGSKDKNLEKVKDIIDSSYTE